MILAKHMEEQYVYAQCEHWWDQNQKKTNQKKPEPQPG